MITSPPKSPSPLRRDGDFLKCEEYSNQVPGIIFIPLPKSLPHKGRGTFKAVDYVFVTPSVAPGLQAGATPPLNSVEGQKNHLEHTPGAQILRYISMWNQREASHRAYVIFLAILVFSSWTLTAQAQDLSSADIAYENGDYETAIILYESALAVGEASGEMYYNSGNAYYMNGEIGEAMQYYLQARNYLPRHATIASQIDLIRTERVDGKFNDVEPIIILHNLSADYLTLSETAILVFVAWFLFFLVLVIGMRRKGWALLIGIFGIVTLLTVGLLSTRVYVENQQPVAVILSETAEVMSGPGDSYLPLFSLYEAMEIRVLEERDGWLRFALADGRQGWIDSAMTGN